ncbi:MAG: LON peptidase substrate-binding domain-containing protein [Proteobacteria bacterium]|nr:LON peptidase substrate-binding domain-containing protein [Pseudomonadota bacterium]
MADLPEIIPVFPLCGALLLPGGRLPLNISEPANLDMIADVLATPGRLIGMIQRKEPHIRRFENIEENTLSCLYPIGCVGRISSFAETGDGRNLITLDGIIRFRIIEEVDDTPYCRCCVSYAEFEKDLQSPEVVRFDRLQLVTLLKRYFNDNGFAADWETVNACADEKLVNTLAMICPLGVQEKQVLLEARDTGIRGDVLSQFLQLENSRISRESPSHDGH